MLKEVLLILLASTFCCTFALSQEIVLKDGRRLSFKHAPFVNPSIINDLTTYLSDTGDQVVAINLDDSQKSNRYYVDIKIEEISGENPFVYYIEDPISSSKDRFGYRYCGQMGEFVVLYTESSGNYSGIFSNIMYITIKRDSLDRTIITKIEETGLGALSKGIYHRETKVPRKSCEWEKI